MEFRAYILLLSLICLASAATKEKKPVIYTGPVQPLENVNCYMCTVRMKNSMVYEGHQDCLQIDSNRTSIKAEPCLAGFCSIMRITQGDVMTVSRMCLPHCKVTDKTDLKSPNPPLHPFCTITGRVVIFQGDTCNWGCELHICHEWRILWYCLFSTPRDKVVFHTY
ncbi:unnamed protein product [Owenia fusiformis]|uniref:Uncharacterized protein n=1 Tax=Owenia fusiformis TaxID=6347 RepID=A0A8S4N4B3_OWEFU|nr:unnamed protein product [Owenia fusiformis]